MQLIDIVVVIVIANFIIVCLINNIGIYRDDIITFLYAWSKIYLEILFDFFILFIVIRVSILNKIKDKSIIQIIDNIIN